MSVCACVRVCMGIRVSARVRLQIRKKVCKCTCVWLWLCGRNVRKCMRPCLVSACECMRVWERVSTCGCESIELWVYEGVSTCKCECAQVWMRASMSTCREGMRLWNCACLYQCVWESAYARVAVHSSCVCARIFYELQGTKNTQ